MLCSTDAQLLMQDAYETTLGIYNHEARDKNRPLALVAMQGSEDTNVGSRLYERIRQFRIRQVPKWYGLSLREFLELPTDYVEFILEDAGKASAEEDKIASALTMGLNQQKGQQQ